MKKLIILLMMFGSVYSQCLGDMNEDGIKDILDIVNLVNDILDGDDVCEEPIIEFNVEYFSFHPDVTSISHIIGNETSIEIIARDEYGNGIANVPVHFSLTQPIFGIISHAFISTNNNGIGQISYYNSEGGEDILKSFILNPISISDTLFYDEITITNNSVTGLIAWSSNPTINVTTPDSVYCDSLFASAIDAFGNTLSNIPIAFALDDNINGWISIINSQTGQNGSPASALFCPPAGFVGYCDGEGCDIYETSEDCIADEVSAGNCSWDNEVNITVSTGAPNVNDSNISIIYLNALEETSICDGLTEVELWGEWYDIATTASLNLYSSELTGSIPPEIGCLINLTYLYLYSNGHTGEIPPEIGNLMNLTSLSLYYNQLTGEIPLEIGNLTNLTYLSLQSNQLTGEIPPEIGNLTNLGVLLLAFNQLTGEIPQSLCDLIESNNLTMGNILEGNNLINTCE